MTESLPLELCLVYKVKIGLNNQENLDEYMKLTSSASDILMVVVYVFKFNPHASCSSVSSKAIVWNA